MHTAAYPPVATRFVWKEYRMLRGLWLAALVLGMLVQWFCGVTMLPHADGPTTFFSIALATAALYAVGAAATSFSVEHEEQTYDFLTTLPTTWLPVWAGKLAVTIVSSAVLAAALSLTGWIAAGQQWPSPHLTNITLRVFGFGIVEAIAWGTLFSLLLRQPLLAALLAITAQSVTLTWAANTFGDGVQGALSLQSYASALPARVAMVAGLALGDVAVARRWLVPGTRGAWKNGARALDWAANSAETQAIAAIGRRIASAVQRRSQRMSVFGHLVWQTWRQSWRVMLAMPAIVLLACFAVALVGGVGEWMYYEARYLAFLPYLYCLAATAVYASAVFYADQRGERYRFLAEHAAWPRYVWLARLTAWLVPIVVLLAVAIGLQMASAFELFKEARSYLRGLDEPLDESNAYWDALMLGELLGGNAVWWRGIGFALWGVAAGFALGQASSLFFRRAIVAGFAAAVVVAPLAIWGFAVWMWELSPTVFLLPLVVGLFVATWLRIPDWLIDRSAATRWLKVIAAVTVPLAIVATLLPGARLTPVQKERWTLNNVVPGPTVGWPRDLPKIDVPGTVAVWVKRYEARIAPAARANGDKLIRIAEQIGNTPANSSRGEFLAWQKTVLNEKRSLIDRAVELSDQALWFPATMWETEATIGRISELIDVLSAAGTLAGDRNELDEALQYHLAAMRIWNAVVDSAPWFVGYTQQETRTLAKELVKWAARDGQTAERIATAQRAIDDIFPTPPIQPATDLAAWELPPALITGYLQLREVLEANRLPHSLDEYVGWAEYVAYLANELPFERERALLALDYLLVAQAGEWRTAAYQIASSSRPELRESRDVDPALRWGGGPGAYLRWRIGRSYDTSYSRYGESFRQRQSPPYSWIDTSYLLRNELGRGAPFGWYLESLVNREVLKWGLKQQLALIAYRLDHGSYPETLAALVPDYLPLVPNDAWAGRPFEYRPQGLDRELRAVGSSLSVEPHTPLLWSVGARNAHLVAVSEEMVIDAEDEPTAEGVEVRREIFVLQYEPGPEFSGQGLVFPLPK